MPISASSTFHFTKSLENLKGILAHKFRLSYCKEKYIVGGEESTSYIPMVSFCDIPLDLAKNHVEKYGDYCIGLTKEWAVRNYLNPVVYIEEKSLLSKDIAATLTSLVAIANANLSFTIKRRDRIAEIIDQALPMIERLQGDLRNGPQHQRDEISGFLVTLIKGVSQQTQELIEQKPVSASMRSISNTIPTLFRYIKNYDGILDRPNQETKKYRFYDEREWRYVPEITDVRLKPSLTPEEYLEFRGDPSTPKPFIPNMQLEFSAEDISFIIVAKETELEDMSKFVRETFGLGKYEKLLIKMISLDFLKDHLS